MFYLTCLVTADANIPPAYDACSIISLWQTISNFCCGVMLPKIGNSSQVGALKVSRPLCQEGTGESPVFG